MTTYQIKLQPTRMLAISESGQTCDFVYHCRGACYSSFMAYIHLQGGPKTAQFFWYALTSSNINRFSKLFHCQNQEKMYNNTITTNPTTPQVCRYTTLWNIKCLQRNNWKQDDFCNNTFFKNQRQGTTCLFLGATLHIPLWLIAVVPGHSR